LIFTSLVLWACGHCSSFSRNAAQNFISISVFPQLHYTGFVGECGNRNQKQVFGNYSSAFGIRNQCVNDAVIDAVSARLAVTQNLRLMHLQKNEN
jgi:hypothetical protein